MCDSKCLKISVKKFKLIVIVRAYKVPNCVVVGQNQFLACFLGLGGIQYLRKQVEVGGWLVNCLRL